MLNKRNNNYSYKLNPYLVDQVNNVKKKGKKNILNLIFIELFKLNIFTK